jgi:hypothetical protein
MKVDTIFSIVLILGLIGTVVTEGIQLNTNAASPGKAFIITAIAKLKAHKDNPTQIPIAVGDFRDHLKDFLSSIKP